MESITCQFMVDPPQSGKVNMAVDETLLELVAKTKIPILRFYSWSEPTLSLGYFQAFAARGSYSSTLSCPVVRRTTGGGAILHDREITYSLCLPRGVRLSRFFSQEKGAEWIYRWVHQALVDVLMEMGSELKFSASTSASDAEPFLCFERRSRWDLEIDEMKILGSAQRSYRGSILQHGSLLLKSSMLTPHLGGLFDQVSPCPVDELISRWSARIAENAHLVLQPITLDPIQQKMCTHLAAEKYGGEKWTKKR